jgi:hypothetical protein
MSKLANWPIGTLLRVQEGNRLWRLRLVDAQHDPPGVEFVFEIIDSADALVGSASMMTTCHTSTSPPSSTHT